ncbi:hypothetical protein PR202_ga14583 [Eleusine coracana subsp. coracana]|uniref:C2 domain-containing protein n=1 Tax=Eleusine coracana subsp. coracana TaxID=191504 RepID=A0AAV5CGZ5_ELECO|nr:hypothetical protein PR202_ga14583 [Eleusine coracana subsp. coracana]
MGLVGAVLGFGLGIAIGLAGAYVVYLRFFAARRLEDPIIRPLRDLNSETLQTIIPDIPLWVKSPDYERVDWMNKFIRDMWPFLDKAICNNIQRVTRPIFDQYVGLYGIESIEFGRLTLGSLPPTFQDVMAIPVLYPFVQDQISKQISVMYHWPKVIQIPILDGASGATKKPIGILHVKVIRAMNLLKMDFLGKSDPYVKMRLSGERLPSKKTSVKMNNLNPEWNEYFRFIVKDPETQVLELHMFDWEKVKMHDKLGMQVIPLRLLAPHESKLFTLDLLRSMNPNDPQNRKNRGKLVVELTFDPFRDDSGRTSEASDDGEGNASLTRRDIPSGGGVLLVSLENAEDVEGKRQTNPYAVVLYKGEQRKTKVMRKTRDPRWNEEFQFMVDEPPVDDKIHIEVRNKRRSLPFRSKESLGHVDINLVDVVNNGRINEKYHLINSRNGKIRVEIKWSTV